MRVSWQFDASLRDRLSHLREPPEPSEIADSIANIMKPVCRHEDPCSDAAGFFRAVYCISVSPQVFDLFFNSRSGYRAAFFRSPYEGIAVNAIFIDRLAPLLAKTGEISARPHIDAASSLKAVSAKLWLAEAGNQLCDDCRGEWKPSSALVAEIQNGRWELWNGRYAGYGSAAPYLKKIRIFGGFINARDDEFIPASKRRRAEELYQCGWS